MEFINENMSFLEPWNVTFSVIKNDSETKWLPEIERADHISMTANNKTIVLKF